MSAIAKLKRWHWILISLVIGYAIAEVRRAFPKPLHTYGQNINDPKTFESAIVREYNGQRLFRNLVVHPIEVPTDGGGKAIKHLVAGEYFHGRPQKKGQKFEAKWEPHAFIASVPFQPLLKEGEAADPARRVTAAMIASAQETRRTATQPTQAAAVAQEAAPPPPASVRTNPPTVVDYLNKMSKTNGVHFTYAWWNHPRWQLAFWLGGSFLVIGLILPTIVNFQEYGTLLRPREEKGPSLLDAFKSTSKTPIPALPRNLSDVEQYDDALEHELANAASEPTHPLAATSADTPAPSLTSKPLDPAATLDHHDDKHFAAKRDDYYPTELKADHHHDHTQ